MQQFVICEIVSESEPSDQDQIWTIDVTPYRSFVNHDME
jgi:hypothetical protein